MVSALILGLSQPVSQAVNGWRDYPLRDGVVSIQPAKWRADGHTPQVNGVGDLMFYSKTGGSPESGVFTAPWDGIHGWYLKNDSAKDVVVTLELAGFYALEAR